MALGAFTLAAAAAAALLPPVTQTEAVDFHVKGLCQMSQPGKGITRKDGEGWLASSLPGPHRIYAATGTVKVTGAKDGVIDLVPGKPVPIVVSPGANVVWCPKFRPNGRAACGPVPPAFLYNATRIGD
jgi:hypothetical protein